MTLSEVKTWTVTADHKARPKTEFNVPNEHVLYSDFKDFEQFARQNTFACDETLLPGDYPAEMFELV